MSIEEKYKIVYINNRHYYKEDLSERDYLVECSTPFYFEYNDIQIFEGSWGQLLYKIALKLNEMTPKSKVELINLKNDWGKQCVFSSNKQKHFAEFEDFYINLNHTAVHALWTIQLLLNFYNIDVKECTLLIHRPSYAEPTECKEYYRELTITGFTNFLIENKIKTENAAKIIKNIKALNKFLNKISKSYEDLFLFDDVNIYKNYVKKINEFVLLNTNYNENQREVMNYCLKKLEKFYNFRRKLIKEED